jgi:DNA-binding FadR family transcriptional regulator
MYFQLIDACVMECYFREHMAERDLRFHGTVAEALQDYDPDASDSEQASYLETVHQRLIAAKIPERIARIPEASPELLAVILNEGKV